MSDFRKGYVRWQGHDYRVTWHPLTNDVYVYWGTDRYAGKAHNLQEAIDTASSWLNGHAK
jgi:hypothetical protein